MQQNQANAKRWDSLRSSLRVCHDAIDSGLSEIQNLGKITNSPNEVDDLARQLIDARRSIQDNLRQAIQTTDEMAALCIGDPIKSAQLSRLEAVTANYAQEFNQTSQTVEQKIERRKLLRPSVVGNQNSSPLDLESGQQLEQQQLLSEKDAIMSSLDILSNAVSQGRESLMSLTRQNDRMVNAGKTIQQFTQRVPHLRTIMSRIHRAKAKQTIVLALVVGCLLLFMLWYSFR